MTRFDKIMFSIIAFCIACLLAMALQATPAHSQIVCMSHDTLENMLASRFSERLTSRALVDKNYMIEIYTSAEGTWTQITMDKDHVACITGAGNGWESYDPAKQGDKT